MRSKFWKSAAALMSVGILMTGCNAENGIMQEPEKPLERDSQFYISVAISSPGEQSTRAEAGYNDNDNGGTYDAIGGTAAEQQIHNILFVFYNSANKYVGDTYVELKDGNWITDDGDKIDDVTTETVGEGDQSTTKMNLIVPVSVAAGSLKPVKVIAYVNPTVKHGEADVKRSLEQALGITRDLEEVMPNGSHKGFTMTNSVYYRTTASSTGDDEGDDAASGEDRTRPVISVSIPSGALVAVANEATQVINIHVERVVAKVSVNKGENLQIKDNVLDHAYENGGDGKPIKYTLDFEILGWGLSNVERGSFLIKNFRVGGNVEPSQFATWFPLTNMNKKQADDEFKTLKNWNYPPIEGNSDSWYTQGYRSFWACSPTYYTGGKYPSFSDEYADNETNYNLIYRSFNDIISVGSDGTPTLGDYGNRMGESLYTLEHTMMSEVVTDHQKRAVTCALVIGQYTLKSDADDGETPRTFFVRNGVKANGETGSWIIPDETSLYKRVLSQELNTVLYVKDGDNYKKVDWNDADYSAYFQIVHPDKVVTSRYTTGAEGETYTPNYTPNRFVSVQLKGDLPANNPFYLRKGDGNYYAVKTSGTLTDTDASLVEANRALYGVLSVEKYHNGYAFFAVPIEHIWGKTDKDGNTTPKIGDKGFSAQLGQYGIVRNHFYQLKINGISGIGTGIGDPTSPIVPNVDEEKYYVKTEMRVMKWRMVPTQEVTLKP